MVDKPFSEQAPAYRGRVESFIDEFLETRLPPHTLGEAIHYAVKTEGKRIRALLAYATAEALHVPVAMADYPAAAIELLHNYSLVHDDLPAMDDDDLRRGLPTVHCQYDEATAILVGDALLTYAFELLASANVAADTRLRWVTQLAMAGGATGMISGQAIDLEGEQRELTLQELTAMHRQKTGALIEASISMVAAAAGDEASEALAGFGHHIGLAFQIRDDLLDVEGSTQALGKPQGSDRDSNKSTFVSLLGADAARASMHDELQLAKQRLDGLNGPAEGLHWLADYIVGREF